MRFQARFDFLEVRRSKVRTAVMVRVRVRHVPGVPNPNRVHWLQAVKEVNVSANSARNECCVGQRLLGVVRTIERQQQSVEP